MTLPAPSANSADAPDLPCPFCGYNLHGIASERCPECGKAIDYATLSSTRIAWENRRRIGRVRAYLRTAAGFTFRPGVLARTGATPDYRDTVRFRLITVLLTFSTVLVPALAWRWFANAPDERRQQFGMIDFDALLDYAVNFFYAPASLAITLLGVLLGMMAMTGAATYFARPASISMARQDRAVILMQYACAPLAWLPLTVGFLAGAIWFHEWLRAQDAHWALSTGLIVCAVIIVVLQMFLWWLATLRVLSASTQAGAGRMIGCATLTPMLCFALVVLTPVVLNLTVSFVVVVLVSLFGH